jgi:ribonuclease HI
MKINVYVDGGSRGNPGPAALGVYIEDENGNEVAKLGQRLGIATNNIAEYSAIVAALNWISENSKSLGLTEVQFFMDSNLAYSQISGLYKIKNANLRELLFLVRQKEAEIDLPILYKHVPREQNKKADKMVNLALDNKI